MLKDRLNSPTVSTICSKERNLLAASDGKSTTVGKRMVILDS